MITTKHLINNIEDCVYENLIGLVSYNNNLQVVRECNAVVRKDFEVLREKKKVLIISGGGSGHEPMFSGFVGSGLLTAAIAGDIFSSPPPRKTLKLIERIAKKENEVLLILANYTGDCLNFGLAREHAILKGYNVELFIFGEDMAFYGEGKRTGRRGLAGIAMIHKIAGALADEGLDLKTIKNTLTEFSQLIGTISISLTASNIPGHGPSFPIGEDDIELGLGAHGEAGVERLKLCSANKAVEVMLNHLVGRSSHLSDAFEQHNNQIVVLINNLGGMSQLELNVVIKEALTQLKNLNFHVKRIYCGSFMTSFDMSGVSITAMAANERVLQLLDSPSSSLAWNQYSDVPKILNQDIFISKTNSDQKEKAFDYEAIDGLKFGREIFLKSIESSCRALISAEKYLNELDEQLGDADCGSTFSSIAKFILKLIEEEKLIPSFFQLAHLMEDNMGGTSGAIYSLMLTAASQATRSFRDRINESSYDFIDFWADVLKYSMDTITRYSSAQPGDRSMLDSLNSAYLALRSVDHTLPYSQIASLVSMSAKRGAETTASMKANVGRASYVNLIPITKPDPGAIAVSIWIESIAQSFQD